MSERTLKIIFASIVFVFIIIGKNYTPFRANSSTAKIETDIISQTASLVAVNEISKAPSIEVEKMEVVVKNESLFSQASSTKILLFNKIKSEPNIKASMFLIGDLDKEENIAQLSVNNRWPIASLTKLMTAIIALEAIPKNTNLIISQNNANIEGSAGFILPDKEFSVDDLIQAMMVSSNNHAAFAIQEYFGKDKFVALMDETAVRIGMNNTHYSEATGLSILNQSTAEDLKIIANYIFNNHKEIFEYSTLREVTVRDNVSNKTFVIKNINLFAGDKNFLGGKTGYITESGGNLVSIFARSDKKIITVVLGADDRFLETKKLIEWFDKEINIK